MQLPEETQVLIVGAGPIGLEMGVALSRAGLDFCIVDAEQVGHTISWYAPGTHFFSSPERIAIAGIPLLTSDQGKATREEYLNYLMSVAWQFDLPIHGGLRLQSIQRRADSEARGGWKVSLQNKWHRPREASAGRVAGQSNPVSTIECRYLVLATGDMHQPRRLDVAGEDQPNVSHYLQELRNYFRQEVVIVGGRNSAVEAAIRIFRMGGKVTMLCRGDSLDATSIKYWLYPEITSLIKNGMIRLIANSVVVRIDGDRVYYQASHSQGENQNQDPAANEEPMGFVEADQILLLTGYIPDNSLYERLGVDLEGDAFRPVHNESMETNLDNVFIAGTATAGSQSKHTVFIENSHEHVERILDAILDRESASGRNAAGANREMDSESGAQRSGEGSFLHGGPQGGRAGSARDGEDGKSLKALYSDHPES
tara:strand:+ start:126809 stop:128086 length:1278 start_codon:yes stop_codon:yes gene_type:complete